MHDGLRGCQPDVGGAPKVGLATKTGAAPTIRKFVLRQMQPTKMTSRKYQDITKCCRTSKPNWRPRIYSTTNPGGVGHAWYRTKFIVPFQEGREWETRFIPARVTDNAFNNPEYRNILEGLTGWQKRAWLDGDWDFAAGQYFTMLRRDIHVIEDFDDTRAVEWFAALDYGFAHYTVSWRFCLHCNMIVTDRRTC